MNSVISPSKKGPTRVGLHTDDKLLVGRQEAAELLSISQRALDYLSLKELCAGPITGLLLFCSDNPIDINNTEPWVCQ